MSDNSESSEFVEYGSECYEVEAIRERKYVRGKPHYFIKWKGWAEQDNTWEPIENLETVMNIVKEFDASIDGKTNSNTTKKDKKLAVQSKLNQTPSNNDLPKKTKLIEKQKKPRKVRQEKSQGEISSSNSQQVSSRSSSKSKQNKKKMDKKQSTKDLNKKTSASENVEKSRQAEKQKAKQRQKDSEKKKVVKESKGKDNQRSREKEKEKAPESSLTKKFNSMSVSQKQPQASKPAISTTPATTFTPQSDMVQITRINYHLIHAPQLPSQTPRLIYNVDRRNRVTRKPLAVAQIPSDQLMKKNPMMIVEYLENFVKEVELCAMEEKEYERRKNGSVGKDEVKLGIIGRMRK